MTDITTIPAEHFAADSATYHADPALSHSQLEDFAESPRLYYGRHVTKEFPRAVTREMEMGTVFHALVLEPESDLPHVLIPPEALNKDGHRKGTAWTTFRDENAGKILLTEEEIVPIAKMLESVEDHAIARKVLMEVDGLTEFNIRFDCHITGMKQRRRARIDRLLGTCSEDFSAIIDIKTVSRTHHVTPKGWAAWCYGMGYHRQAATYIEAVRQLCGRRLDFVFVVCLKEPPFDVLVTNLRPDFLDYGEMENARLLEQFDKCQRTDSWNSETHNQVVTVAPPHYAGSDLAWETME